MTKSRAARVFFLVMLVLVSFYAGTKVAYNIAKKRIDAQYQSAYKEDLLTDVKGKILVLTSLRAGDYTRATNALEDFIDVDLNALSEYFVVNKGLKSDKEMEEIATYVKGYRARHKDHKVSPRLEKSVNSLLNIYGQ